MHGKALFVCLTFGEVNNLAAYPARKGSGNHNHLSRNESVPGGTQLRKYMPWGTPASQGLQRAQRPEPSVVTKPHYTHPPAIRSPQDITRRCRSRAVGALWEHSVEDADGHPSDAPHSDLPVCFAPVMEAAFFFHSDLQIPHGNLGNDSSNRSSQRFFAGDLRPTVLLFEPSLRFGRFTRKIVVSRK